MRERSSAWYGVCRIKETLEGVAAEGLNMDRMKDIVGRRMQKTLNELESNPHNSLSNTLIWYFLYGRDEVRRAIGRVLEPEGFSCSTFARAA